MKIASPSSPLRGRQQIEKVKFFETAAGNQPVMDFLCKRSEQDQKEISSDILTVQQGFPMGLPHVKKISNNL
jgi:hypothetical protein